MTTQEDLNKEILAAARLDNIYILQECIKKGAKVNCQDVHYNDQSPLHWAAWKGSTETAEVLLESGAYLLTETRFGEQPLHYAAMYGKTEVVELLLKKGASLYAVSFKGWTPLHHAVMKGYIGVVDLLIKEGASLSVRCKKGWTPLHYATGHGKTEVVRLLLKKGAPLHITNFKGEQPLHTAAIFGRTEVVELLLNNGASPCSVNFEGWTPLHYAARHGKTGTVELLLKKGALTSVVNKNGEQPLHTAAMYGKTEVVDILIENGASVYAVSFKGWTPLHHAAKEGYRDVVLHLINKDASMRLKCKKGWTPLHYAAGHGQTEVVELLLKKGASTSVVNKNARTPLHIAAMYDRTEEVSLLSKKGALLNVKDNEDWTPLHHAAMKGYIGVVDLLIKEGASLSVQCNEGKTPYEVSRGKTKDMLQKYVNTKDMPATNEIVAQGTFISYGNFVYLGGDCNVGKSTLASILIDEEISQHWKSTDGLTTYFGRNGIDLKSKEMVPLKQATIQEDIKQEIKYETYKIGIAPSDLAGFRAQMYSDPAHQLFIRHKGTFVLMFNGTIDLSVHLKDDEQDVTTKSIFKHWVNCILSCCADDEDILPKIMFCATHSDHYNKEERIRRKAELIRDLEKIFKIHKKKHRIIYDDIFFINGKEKTDTEIKRLKFKLGEVACQQHSWGVKRRMAWVPLDIQLSELRIHNMNIISKEELLTLNRRNDYLKLTDQQANDFLSHQHSLRNILYFDKPGLDHLIIVQPLSLVNILRSFIIDELFWPKDAELRGILSTLTNTRKIAKQDLLKLWSQGKFHQYMPNDDFKEFIIKVLVHLDILVELKHCGQEQENKVQSYRVPHRVPNVGHQ